MNSYRTIKLHASIFQDATLQIIKISIYNCASKMAFLKSSHILEGYIFRKELPWWNILLTNRKVLRFERYVNEMYLVTYKHLQIYSNKTVTRYRTRKNSEWEN